ncbi:MAG: PEP-CTERM sorting domain-containing protein [Acidobacteria bacterium]|nr:PEP-CTERM sorting domain-containing protein [Acidobacteriota bacterium]
MKRVAAVLAVCLAFFTTVSRGDTLRTFSITGATTTFNTLTGQVTIDTTTGMGLYGYVQFTDLIGPYPPVQMNLSGPIMNAGCDALSPINCEDFPDTHLMKISSTNLAGTSLVVFLPTPTGLVDYMGGPLCPYLNKCQGDEDTEFLYQNFPYPPFELNGQLVPGWNGDGVEPFNQASLTLVSEVQTPEPSSWLLMGSGALGMLGMWKRRRLKAPETV